MGDEKQSIFSFQGADPAQFDINRVHFRKLARDAGIAFLDQPLITSRRSAPDILTFVDKVFEPPESREGLTSDNIAIEHRAYRETARGGIAFWPALKPADVPDVDIYRPVDVEQPHSPVVVLAGKIADQILGWLRQGAKLPGHDHPIAPRDIMILLPRREPFGGEIIRQLKQRNIPVAGADRVVLTEQIAAMDLIALGRFALQREDDLNLAAVLRSPLCGLSEEELFALAHGRKGHLWPELMARRDETLAFAASHELLADMLERADYAPPFEFYSHALVARGGKEKLLARLGAESADAIDEFLSLALTYERGATPSLEGFLDWVERGGTEIKRDMERGRNEVRVMTVHGAKGLEADIVILPDTTSLPEPPSRKGHLLYHEGEILFPLADANAPQAVRTAKLAAEADALREHRRLLYVALTRARDRLYVCGFENRKGVKDGSWYRLAEAAAKNLGKPIQQGDDEIHAIGALEMEFDVRTETAPAQTALHDWVRAPAPIEPPLPRLIRPSEAVGIDPPTFSPKGAARFRRGLVVHALLARLPEVALEKRRDIALAFVRAHGFAEDAAEKLVNETLAVLDDPQFAAAFGPHSRAEAGLLAELPQIGPGVLFCGGVHRQLVSDPAGRTLDLQARGRAPAREGDVAPVYLAQMALYRAAAERIFPGRRIVCGLLFTDGPRLMQLSDVLLDAQLREITVKLAAGSLSRPGRGAFLDRVS